MNPSISSNAGEYGDIGGIPRVPLGFMERPRLTSALNSAQDCALIVVRAPGGSGKSGLIAAWLRGERNGLTEAPHRHVWVSLDEGSQSRAGFWRRVVRSLEPTGQIAADSSLSHFVLGTAELQEVPGYFLDHLERRREHTLLVLDDFHLVDDSNAADIIWVLERTEWLRVIVTTRRVGAFESAELSSRLATRVITFGDLVFTPEETRTLFATTTRCAADYAHVVHEATDGHPLATRIAMTLLAQRPETIVAELADSSALARQLADRIAHTLLPSFATAEQLNVAAILSLPPEASAELTSTLVNRDIRDSDQLLTNYANEGFGEFHPGDREMVFRFHPLVSQALRRHASRTLSPTELSTLRRLSADHLNAYGNGLGALKLYILAGEFGSVWPTVSKHFSELINHQQDELHALLTTIPLDVLRRHGTVAISLAIVMSERERMPSARLRQLVRMGIEEIDSLPAATSAEEALSRSLARFAGLRSARRYPEAATQGNHFISLIHTLSPEQFATTAPAIGAGLIQVVITNVLLGRWRDATEIAHYLSADEHPGRAQHRSSLLAYVSAFLGDMAETRAQLNSVTFAHAVGWHTSVPSTGWHLATTLLHLEAGDLKKANDTICALDGRLGLLEHWPFALWTKALLQLARGDAEQALQEFDIALKLHEFRPLTDYAQGLLSSMKSDLYLATGHRNDAYRELENFPDSTVLVAPRFSRVRLLLAHGDVAAASAMLDETPVRERGTFRETAEGILLRAVIEARQQNDSEAILWARRGFDLMARHGLRTPLLMVPHSELRMLIENDAADLLQQFDGIADPFGVALLESPLTPRERKVLTTLAGAASIDDVAKVLFVSPNTVKSQLKSIYKKLEVSSGAAAIRVAKDRGFIPR